MAPLRIETGRYGQNPLPESQRLCINCPTVETEEQVLLECPLYQDLQAELFEQSQNLNNFFYNLTETDKLVYILSNPDICKSSARICYHILIRRRKLLYN